jgi:hypothetical protein
MEHSHLPILHAHAIDQRMLLFKNHLTGWLEECRHRLSPSAQIRQPHQRAAAGEHDVKSLRAQILR